MRRPHEGRREPWTERGGWPYWIGEELEDADRPSRTAPASNGLLRPELRQQESEVRYQELFEHLRSGVVVCVAEGRGSVSSFGM